MAIEKSKVESREPRAKARKSGVVVPHKAKWHQRLAAVLIFIFIRAVTMTVRFRLDDRSRPFNGAPGGKFIFAVWHNRLALCLMLYRRYAVRSEPDRRMAAIVSASRDGGMLARILEHFNVEPVRGSSSRRGGQALREMVSCAEHGCDLGITPDGPRGPCYQVQEGVISTAQLTGLPIVPASYHLNWKIRLKSWDRFQVPLPFSRCVVTIGRIMRVPRRTTDAERKEFRKQLEAEMRRITRD
jgi:lysophospholipid acyltransferase (LPLAT)-like uncharacterized protein